MMIKTSFLYKLYRESGKISIDSRKIPQGALFFALKGDHVDGNHFAKQAIESGASYSIVDRHDLATTRKCIYVPNVLTTLHRLAKFHRAQFDIPVLAITGTNGKTTSKELIASVLSQRYKVHSTKGNFNNHLGVPLSLLALPDSTEIAVIEMGANHVGEINWLCQIANPNLGLITNIGSAHLEGFGSIRNIKETKLELYRYLGSRGGKCFINLEEKSVRGIAAEVLAESIPFSSKSLPSQDKRSRIINFTSDEQFIGLDLITPTGTSTIKTQLYGKHNHHNILCALAIGSYFGLTRIQMAAGLQDFRLSNNRTQVLLKGNNTIYLDAYNANPTSVRAGIEFLNGMDVSCKILILGDMLELGHYTEKAHQNVVLQISSLAGFHFVLLVGQFFKQALSKSKVGSSMMTFENSCEAKGWVKKSNIENCHIFIKGSRGMLMENVVDAF